MELPLNVVYVVVTHLGHIRNANGTHSTRGSFFLTEKGARGACHHENDVVLRGEIKWERI
jgi:hypothetical protein